MTTGEFLAFLAASDRTHDLAVELSGVIEIRRSSAAWHDRSGLEEGRVVDLRPGARRR